MCLYGYLSSKIGYPLLYQRECTLYARIYVIPIQARNWKIVLLCVFSPQCVCTRAIWRKYNAKLIHWYCLVYYHNFDKFQQSNNIPVQFKWIRLMCALYRAYCRRYAFCVYRCRFSIYSRLCGDITTIYLFKLTVCASCRSDSFIFKFCSVAPEIPSVYLYLGLLPTPHIHHNAYDIAVSLFST